MSLNSKREHKGPKYCRECKGEGTLKLFSIKVGNEQWVRGYFHLACYQKIKQHITDAARQHVRP